MTKLCVDSQQITMLELLMMSNQIPYEIDETAPDQGLGYPYLVVDGVPLDEERAIKWMKGCSENE